MEEKREHSKATVLTIITLVISFLVLFFFGFKALIPEGEEGIMINFGNTVLGQGAAEPAPAKVVERKNPVPVQTPPPKPVAVNVQEAVEEVKTQDIEEAPAVPVKKKEKTKAEIDAEKKLKAKLEADRQLKIEQDRLEKERQEQERLEQERIEKDRLEKERQAAEIRKRTQNAFSGGKGTATTAGQGTSNTAGNAGDVRGDLNSGSTTGAGIGNKGSGYDLSGRSLVGSLPLPTDNIQEEGIVVIQIEVDKNGKVISATPILRGATTQDARLQKAAIEAALRARFNSDPTAPSKQNGTITYHFQLD